MNSLECCTEIVGKNCVSYGAKCLELASERLSQTNNNIGVAISLISSAILLGFFIPYFMDWLKRRKT